MPIRMEKDDPRSNQGPSRDSRNTGGGANALLRLLPLALLFLFRKPKLLIPILALAAVWYFFLGGKEFFASSAVEEMGQDFSFGATLDEAVYDKAEVFEPLAYSASQNRLPASANLTQHLPPRLHQGQQGSCVGWASSYAARTILEAQSTGRPAREVAFSPSYLYNQIALTNCQGAYMRDAMESLHEGGVLQFSEYPYNDRSCSVQPSASQRQKAQQFRIKGYNRLTLGANNYKPDLMGVKQHLAQGAPVVIGMQVGGTFMHEMRGQKLWQPNRRDYSLYGYSGHAMCVVGYDDNYQGGAFQIMNSWGNDWGDDGLAWVRYQDFEYFVKEAYGLYPMGNTQKYDPNKLAVKFGLVDNASQSLIPLREVGNQVFRTRAPIRKGDKFKVAITNSIECYIYVFGEETDGSSYVLFPYTNQHSPYCGITGTRLFPKDYSLTADEIGSRDRIAIVISKLELDYEKLNQLINQSRRPSYAEKVQEVLNEIQATGVQFQAGDAIDFQAATSGNRQVVSTIIEMDKR